MQKTFVMVLITVLFITGCKTLHNVDRVTDQALKQESTIVFVRPTEYSIFGTKSISDYMEISYETAKKNTASLLVVKAGLRNRGGQHFWDTIGPQYQISVKTTFYETPMGYNSAPVYETNWETVTMRRGDTHHYQAICPRKNVDYYQITISE